MAFQTWMADVLRRAGLTVVEVDGWRTRGSETFTPQGLIIHETRGSATSTDASEIRVMIEGREGLEGPIAQLYLSRTGTWFVVTAGRSNHVKTATTGPFAGLGNSRLMGIEAQHAGGEPWTPVQYDSYVRGAAAILAYTGWPPPVGHKEHQPNDKPDPAFDMARFRADVAAAMRGETMILVRVKGDPTGKVWLADGIRCRWVENQTELTALQAAAKLGDIYLANAGKIREVASIAPYGREAAAPGTPVEVDLDAFAAKVAAQLGGLLASADRASADVLAGAAV